MNKICPDVIVENELKSILDYRSKVKGICEVLTRDHMKVAFFGRFVFFCFCLVVCSLKLTNNGKFLNIRHSCSPKFCPLFERFSF